MIVYELTGAERDRIYAEQARRIEREARSFDLAGYQPGWGELMRQGQR